MSTRLSLPDDSFTVLRFAERLLMTGGEIMRVVRALPEKKLPTNKDNGPSIFKGLLPASVLTKQTRERHVWFY